MGMSVLSDLPFGILLHTGTVEQGPIAGMDPSYYLNLALNQFYADFSVISMETISASIMRISFKLPMLWHVCAATIMAISLRMLNLLIAAAEA